jgi:hypothetical protein
MCGGGTTMDLADPASAQKTNAHEGIPSKTIYSVIDRK